MSIKLAVLGAGSRGHDMYSSFYEDFKDRIEFVAVCDKREESLKKFQNRFNLSDSSCFLSDEDFFAQGKLADGLLVCTQDQKHYDHAMKALEIGYDLLLEKPISTNLNECEEIRDTANRLNRRVMVCHVLRYSVFYQTVKRFINEGKIGDTMCVNTNEDVAFWHQAHSFTRGNWRDVNTSGPIILTKCCHDMDLLLWLTRKKPKKVSSFGNLSYFKAANAPEGATLRCLDGCKAKEECPYDAEKIYVQGRLGVRNNVDHPVNILNVNPTEENIYKAIREGPYGRCVFHCDNNVVDHQVVNVEFEDGTTASHTMAAFNNGGRDIKVMGTKGFIYTQNFGNEIVCAQYSTTEDKYEVVDINTLTDDFSGHGGGDKRLFEDFISMLEDSSYMNANMTTIDDSVLSHVLAFAAEESRVEGKTVIL